MALIKSCMASPAGLDLSAAKNKGYNYDSVTTSQAAQITGGATPVIAHIAGFCIYDCGYKSCSWNGGTFTVMYTDGTSESSTSSITFNTSKEPLFITFYVRGSAQAATFTS